MKKDLTTRQKSFVKHIASGNNATKSAELAGYSKKSARFTASKLLTNDNILQQLEELFAQAGLSDEQLIDRLKTSIDAGLGQKANNSDAIKGLKMAFELKNRFPSTHFKAEMIEEDSIQMKLKSMTSEELIIFMEETAIKTQEIVARLKARHNGDDRKSKGMDSMEEKVATSATESSFPKAVGVSIASSSG